MPLFKSDWHFFGFVQKNEIEDLEKLLIKYKCKKRYGPSGLVHLNDPFRIDSIRKRLWGHRWATSKNWIDENPHLKDFDPRAKVALGPRCQAKADARKQKR